MEKIEGFCSQTKMNGPVRVLRVCLYMRVYTLPHCGGGEEVGGLPVSALTDLGISLFMYFYSPVTLDREIRNTEIE